MCMLLYIIFLYVTLLDYFGCANWIYSPEIGYIYKEEDKEETTRTRSNNSTGFRREKCFGLPCVAWFTL